jgi:hypothetical protein
VTKSTDSRFQRQPDAGMPFGAAVLEAAKSGAVAPAVLEEQDSA